MAEDVKRDPAKVSSYFIAQWPALAVVTVSGIIYNVGMAAGPWFEGQLAQCLVNILQQKARPSAMVKLSLGYVLAIFIVQFMRYLKRLYVRKFANQTILSMRSSLYQTLLTKTSLDDIGTIMTKAISDADDCAEGMRKFTTEIFDTGVVMIVYIVMLMCYDWRLSLIALLFPPLAYVLAGQLKKVVTGAVAKAQVAAGDLNAATLDRAGNSLTYRIYGVERIRDGIYEKFLQNYEKRQIKAGVLMSAAEPIYYIISSISVIFIIWLGGRNVCGLGWQSWNIAAFSTYLACFGKLSVKSSHAANLFNAVQKAEVSWKRIKPLLTNDVPARKQLAPFGPVKVKQLTFSWKDDQPLLENISLTAKPGEIVGVTGPVACGKSTFGQAFLGQLPYSGTIELNGQDLRQLQQAGYLTTAYLGHDPQLLAASIKDNIALGQEKAVSAVLSDADLVQDLEQMPDKAATQVGDGGTRLSGGQAARVALARALYHERPILILDDPFASVDQKTEMKILQNLRQHYHDRVIFLISHRLEFFASLDQILYIDGKKTACGKHADLLKKSLGYAKLYCRQVKGGSSDEK